MADQGRILEIERLVKRLLRENDILKSQMRDALQSIPRAFDSGGGGSGGSKSLRWVRVPSGGSGAATGTWPTLTQATFTADVYGNASGTLALIAEDATIYWKYLDAAAEGKIVPVVLNADGSTWDAVLDSCTAVDLDA